MSIDSNSLNTFFSDNPDLILLVDKEGKITDINKTVINTLGYSYQEIINSNVADYIESDIEEFIRNFKSAIAGEYGKTEIAFISKKYKQVECIAKLFPLKKDNKVESIFIIAEDLFIKKKEYETYKYKERLFKLIADNSKDLIIISSIEGKYLFISPASSKILGYEPEELIGSYRKDYIPSFDYAKINGYLGRTTTDKICTYTYRFKHKDGKYIWLESTIALMKDETGYPIQTFSISRDITDRLRTENILKESEKRHRILVEESPNSIIVYQLGKWVYINDTGVKLLGANNKEEIIGKKPYDFIHPDYHDLFRKQKRKVQRGTTVNFVEEKWVKLDGKIIEVEIKAIPFIFDGKTAIHIVINDISERKKMHELAQKAEKLFLVGQLAAGMAHEIRNPLTSVKGFLQFVKNDIANKDYLDIMLSEINRIDLITSELLVFAKPKFNSVSIINIKDLLEQVITLINTQAILHNCQIVSEYPEEKLLIEAEENQIKQALINILENGLEAMPNGGKLKIELTKIGEEVVIQISDKGIGISEEKLKRIGEPFYTTKEKGTGLGMMVTYKIIQNHKGKINVYSKINEGTIFEVILPSSNKV